MEIHGSRFIVAGATGVLGEAIARSLAREGVELALAGRDRKRLEELGEELEAPTAAFDARDIAGCGTAVEVLSTALGGLDGIVVACGVAAFGAAGEVDPALLDDLFAANALAPIALVEAALGQIEATGCVAAVTGMVAEFPMARLAHYSAAKAALSAYLAAVGRERRRSGPVVLDVRPPHMDTGFAERPLFGTAPERLPEPAPVEDVVAQLLDAIREGRRELAWKPMQTEPVAT